MLFCVTQGFEERLGALLVEIVEGIVALRFTVESKEDHHEFAFLHFRHRRVQLADECQILRGMLLRLGCLRPDDVQIQTT